MGHLLRHPAKSKGEVIRSPRSPRLSPLLVSLAQSTEHPGNSRGLMGHLLRHPAKSKGEVIRSPRSPRFSPLLVSLAQSTEHPGNSRGLMGHLLRHPANAPSAPLSSLGALLTVPKKPTVGTTVDFLVTS